MILREALLLVVAGVAVGVPVALIAARLGGNQISGLLFGLEATDPITIVRDPVVGLGHRLSSGKTCAASVDPMVALRNE